MMKPSVKLFWYVLLVFSGYFAKAQEQENVDSTEDDQQDGTIQSSGGNRVGRIFYGVQTTIENHPYAALIKVFGTSGNIRLTGAIISNTQVLTSASGLLKAGNLTSISVVAGSTTTDPVETFPQKSYAIHSDFNATSLANDVAIITVNGSFAGLANVVPISIPASQPTISATNRTICTIVGWGLYEGYENSRFLRYATYELFTDAECVAFAQNTPPTILCGRSLNGHACTADDGAPLVCNNQLYGILTHQASCDMTRNSGLYKFAKLPVINLAGYLAIDTPLTATRKNYVSCP
ncbi:trypsin delta-like [Anopheles albimanus]|nr:trypsin delta-like [Anopheles albimanus]